MKDEASACSDNRLPMAERACCAYLVGIADVDGMHGYEGLAVAFLATRCDQMLATGSLQTQQNQSARIPRMAGGIAAKSVLDIETSQQKNGCVACGSAAA